MMNIGIIELAIVGLILFLLGLVAAVVLIVLASRRSPSNAALQQGPPGNTAATTAPRETPLDVLKMRYARGEITKEQFEQMRRDLEG